MKPLLLSAIVLFFLNGCVQSLQPFYNDSQLAYEPALSGNWSDTKREITLLVTGSEQDRQYSFTYINDKAKVGHFIGHLAKVDGQLLADVFPDELKTDDNDEYKAHLLPLHSFFLVSFKPDELRLRTMDADWLKKTLTATPDAVPFQKLGGDRFVLTGSTEQVQAFVLKNIKTESAFGEEMVFTRLPTTQPATQPVH